MMLRRPSGCKGYKQASTGHAGGFSQADIALDSRMRRYACSSGPQLVSGRRKIMTAYRWQEGLFSNQALVQFPDRRSSEAVYRRARPAHRQP